ncbi:hypothetical protein niasHT_005700 [Heterodera trifolii]|uniref:Effector protein n=1 Tax=Heterodera trifolii TaxID=157864 RepID=A0ABD2M3E8_9BILA
MQLLFGMLTVMVTVMLNVSSMNNDDNNNNYHPYYNYNNYGYGSDSNFSGNNNNWNNTNAYTDNWYSVNDGDYDTSGYGSTTSGNYGFDTNSYSSSTTGGNYDYGNSSESSAPALTKKKKEVQQMLRGNIQIRETDSDGLVSYRSAKKNEVCFEVYCGTNNLTDGIFTDRNGNFDETLHKEQIKALKKCKFGIHIGFYKHEGNILKKTFQNNLDYNANSVRKIFAKIGGFDCLIFSSQGESDGNNFTVDFYSKPRYALINGAEAKQIAKEFDFAIHKYRIYRDNFQKEEKSIEEACSSGSSKVNFSSSRSSSKGKNKVEKLAKTFSSLWGGKNKDKKQKQPHVFDLI